MGRKVVHNFTLLQMMNYLKRDLTTLEVEYTEKVFNSADGVGGLGPEPFVSVWYSLCLRHCFTPALITLQDLEARIYVLAMYSSHARALMCEVRLFYKGKHGFSH